MISVARAVLERAEAGVADCTEFDAVPAAQWLLWYDDLRPHCPSLSDAGPAVKQRPAVRIRGRYLLVRLVVRDDLHNGCCVDDGTGECPFCAAVRPEP